MKLKESVRFGDESMAMACAFIIANTIFEKHGYELIITSVNDSTHSVNSLHYKNKAFDARSKHIETEEKKLEILHELKEALPGFDILYENPDSPTQHYHLEHDQH